jgi:hypothetical protein
MQQNARQFANGRLGAEPSVPLWVKVSAVVLALVLLLVAVLHLTGNAPAGHDRVPFQETHTSPLR